MAVPPSLVEILIANALEGTKVGTPSGMERLLHEAFEAARAAWPGLELTAEQFIRHLAQRLPASSQGQDVDLVLESRHLSDLYLACACALGIPRAADALERKYISKIPSILRRHSYSPEAIDDVCQKLREKLVLRGHIATYTGEGRLSSWVEVIAKRTANKEARLAEGDSSGFSKIVAGAVSMGDLEKDVLKQNLLAKLRAALREATAVLSDEQREMLKFHYRDGWSEAKLAAFFKTSQPTVSRRLKSARQTIFEETKRQLRVSLSLAEADFESFIAEVQSRWLDLSLSQVFGASEAHTE